MKTRYHFTVPDQKRVRMIVAGHFDLGGKMYKSGRSATASLEEVNRILDLMDAHEYPSFLGAQGTVLHVNISQGGSLLPAVPGMASA